MVGFGFGLKQDEAYLVRLALKKGIQMCDLGLFYRGFYFIFVLVSVTRRSSDNNKRV